MIAHPSLRFENNSNSSKKSKNSFNPKIFKAVGDKFKDQDSFAQHFTMKIDNDGVDNLKSLMGAVCSLLLTFLVCIYAYQKMDVFLEKKDVDILSATNDLFYTDEDIFSYKNGLNVAVAFTAYDTEESWILDETYGELIFNSYSWGPQEDGSYGTVRKLLESHVCEKAELHLDEDNLDKARF